MSDKEGNIQPTKDTQPIIPPDDDAKVIESAGIQPAPKDSYISLSDLVPPKRDITKEDVQAATARLQAQKELEAKAK